MNKGTTNEDKEIELLLEDLHHLDSDKRKMACLAPRESEGRQCCRSSNRSSQRSGDARSTVCGRSARGDW